VSSLVRRITAAAAAVPSSSDERAAKTPPTSRPTGVAITKPAFAPPTRTPGVASAWRPRKPALAMNESEIRKSRASRRRMADWRIV
jgi:hypothetical protein